MMNLWESFWGAVIVFSTITFTYMSAKVVYKGFAELKEMFSDLKNETTEDE